MKNDTPTIGEHMSDVPMLRVTIYDAEGNIVTDEYCEAQTASQEELDEMIALIGNGAPAHLAASLVKMGKP